MSRHSPAARSAGQIPRRTAVARLAGASAAALATTACGRLEPVARWFGPDATLSIVFADVSGSTPAGDWQLYEQTYHRLVAALQPGDRLVLGSISDVTLTGFRATADKELPYTGIELDDTEGASKIRASLQPALSSLRHAGIPATRSRILESLQVAADVIAGAAQHQRYRLVLCSDMLEDSELAVFERHPVTDDFRTQLIARQRQDRSLPQLAGASIYVVGASATSAAKYFEVRKFWLAYFRETGAMVDDGRYGRTLPRFA